MYGLGIAKGMLVTLRHFFGTYRLAKDPFRGKAIVTTQYPDERAPLPERFRGRPLLLRNQETGKASCTACGVCVRACPHGCITLESHMGPDRKRVVDKYTVDLAECIMCGLCADSCAFNSLGMSHEFELACYDRRTMLWDADRLLEPWKGHEVAA
jgi:NADH-quinone oxidoreductase subunit I